MGSSALAHVDHLERRPALPLGIAARGDERAPRERFEARARRHEHGGHAGPASLARRRHRARATSGTRSSLSASSCSSITTTTARSGTGAHTALRAPIVTPAPARACAQSRGSRRRPRRSAARVRRVRAPWRPTASPRAPGRGARPRARAEAGRPTAAVGPLRLGRSVPQAGDRRLPPPIGTVPMSGSGSRDTSVGGDAAVRIGRGTPRPPMRGPRSRARPRRRVVRCRAPRAPRRA